MFPWLEANKKNQEEEEGGEKEVNARNRLRAKAIISHAIFKYRDSPDGASWKWSTSLPADERIMSTCMYVLTLTYNWGLSSYLFDALSYVSYLKTISHDTSHTHTLVHNDKVSFIQPSAPSNRFQFHSKWQLFVICHGIIELTFLSSSRRAVNAVNGFSFFVLFFSK